jgi:outer membrane protein
MTPSRLSATTTIVLVALLDLAVASRAGAQVSAAGGQQGATGSQAISLADALRRAETQSEQVGIARAGVTRASGEEITARSQAFPQISASAGYTRTLKSQFEGAFGGGGDTEPQTPTSPPAPCAQYFRDGTATLDERISGVETATRCSLGLSAFDGFGDLPFGQENQYNLGLQLSQALFSGGRISAANDVARSGRRVADIELGSQQAQLKIDVTEAYYDAALADRLVEIADSSLAQTEQALRLMELGRQVGDKSEFDLLRARVTRDNQRPVLIERRSQRDVAYFRLKQLLGIPFETRLQLTTGIQDENLQLGGLPSGSDTTSSMRATVRQAAEAVTAQEGLLRIQRSERLPTVNLSSAYGKVGYPSGLPGWNDFLDNWTVGVALQVPVFTGGRLRGSELVARAGVDEARLRLQQVNELAALDARATIATLQQSEEAWRASLGTVEQAQRAYEIAQVRFREGLSTQLELTESRVLLQQAQANRAVAARNLQVIQVRLTLLRDLPLNAGGSSQQTGGSAQQQLQQQLQQRMQQQGSQSAPPGAAGGTGQVGGIGGGTNQ